MNQPVALPLRSAAVMILALVMPAGGALAQPAPPAKTFATQTGRVVVEPAATGTLEHPWGMAFLPDRSILVTERPGRLRLIRDGRISAPITGVPEVRARGQGGLLDVALDPDFVSNRTIYLSYAEPRQGGNGATAVARAALNDAGTALSDVRVIWRQEPAYSGNNHWGSRLVFGRDKTLFITTGDRFNQRDKAQDLGETLGKVVRINRDGSIPRDNPFVGRDGARPEIWSYGHRNLQGATLHPQSGALWTTEHGARGGDEVNIPQAGRNYGWPVITYGIDYSGLKIGEGTAKSGMEQPVYYWDPSIAPSGLIVYTGDAFPAWRGNLISGALAAGVLVRLTLSGDRVTGEERMLEDLGERVRDVEQGPDGFIYLLSDSPDGRLWRVRPAS